jgi:hypothetical protein
VPVHRMVVRYSPVAEAPGGTSAKSATKTAHIPPESLRLGRTRGTRMRA